MEELKMKGIQFEHESYGMIDISRTSGGARTLFGSDVKHSNTIRLKIKNADYTRGLNSDWFHGKDTLIEIEMSPVQFAEAITNMNTSGVPCTIRYFNNEMMSDCPSLNKKEMFRKEFNEDITEVNDKISELIEEVQSIIENKKPINKSDKEKLSNGLYRIQQQLNANMPFVAQCFDEQMEKSVAHSKAEVEAYIAHKINSLGLKALQEGDSILQIEE